MVRWAPLLLVVALLAVLVPKAARPLTDPDVFWHLRIGHMLIDQGSLATPDWSTRDDRPWVLTQWLSQLVMAVGEDMWGLPGVAWLFGLSLILLAAGLYALCRQRSEPLVAGVVTGLAIFAMSSSISPRPHMVSYLLLVVTLLAWLRIRDDLRPRWWLIPMTWLWAMSHGMWFLGPLVGLAVVTGLTLDHRLNRATARRLWLVPVLSVLAAAVTPLGPKVMTAPVAVGGISSYVAEWQPPSFLSPAPACAAAMVAFVAICWARSPQRAPWDRVLLLLLAAGWIVLSVRTVTLGAAICAPLLAQELQTLTRASRGPRKSLEVGVIVGGAVMALVALGLTVPTAAATSNGYPSGLNKRLATLPAGTPVVNQYIVGGWLRWRHPQLDPLIDGMTEAYSVQELDQYGRLTSTSKGWRDILDATRAHHALLATGSPLALALVNQLGWDVAGTDTGYVLLSQEPGRS